MEVLSDCLMLGYQVTHEVVDVVDGDTNHGGFARFGGDTKTYQNTTDKVLRNLS